MHDPRERGMSARFSEAVRKGGDDHLDDGDAILHLMFSEEVRRKKIISFIAWGLINLTLAIYIGYLIGRYWYHWGHACIGQLSFWLIGYLVIHVAHLIRKIILICFWWKGKDPTILEV